MFKGVKGSGDFIKNIKYVIMEEPKPIIDLRFLPKDTYSKYSNAPSPIEISNFMKENNFTEIVRIPENHIEDNVMYKKIEVKLCFFNINYNQN